MATPSERLAKSLDVLKQIQDSTKRTVFRSSEISRTHLERLVENGFLMKVISGWYIQSDPSAGNGDTTSWYISYWQFIKEFITDRLGEDWSLTPEVSLDVQTGNWSVLPQLIVRSRICSNTTVKLPFNCSIFFLKADPATHIETEGQYGLNLYSVAEAIVMSSPVLYTNNALTARIALSTVKDASDILSYLLDKGRSSRAERVIGAFYNCQMVKIAEDIKNTMVRYGYNIRITDPFTEKYDYVKETSPYATRVRLMWRNMREDILQVKPKLPESLDIDAYLEDVEERYKLDAYHSLSIEGYKVTEELIEKVRSGHWNPMENKEDREDKSALAARGYWQSFQTVKESLRTILKGGNAGTVVENDHRIWYQEMFASLVMVGILKASDVVGYRSHQVYIRNSMHTPLNAEAVRDTMPVLFDLLKNEPDAWVRAVAGHFLFTFIHPYMDGNGRMGRFLMNVMLASGGYRWTIISKDDRDQYMSALEQASIQGNITPFATFLANRVSAPLHSPH